MKSSQTRFNPAAALVLFAALAAPFAASAAAAPRSFEPVAKSAAQQIQIVGGSAIITASATSFGAGASTAPASSKQLWLSVSVKNTGADPIAFSDEIIRVTGVGKALTIRTAEEALKPAKDDGLVRDKCAHASASSQLNCNIDSFNGRQDKRLSEASLAEQAAARQVAPGKLLARQFQIDLPKKSKAGPTTLNVEVSVGGESVSFDFREVD